jgi:hypothetical protein
MKTNMLTKLGSKPVLLGAFAVSASALTLLSAWDVPDPGMDGEDVNIPDGKLVASGPLISQTGTPNVVSDVNALVAGTDNDLYRTGTTTDIAKACMVIGYGNDYSTTTFGSATGAVIGYQNNVRSMGGLTVGNVNEVTTAGTSVSTYARFTNVFGVDNTVTGGAYGTFVHGESHTLNADHSLVSGESHTLEGATTGSKTTYSLAAGYDNHIMADQASTIGTLNVVSSNQTIALGTGLEADAVGCTFVGEYNDPTGASLTTRASDEPVFVVGSGTADNARATAFTVLRDGGVVLSRAQGDISMGDFDE